MTAATVPDALEVRRLPRWAPAATAVAAAVLAFVLFKVAGILGGGWVLTVAGTLVFFLLGLLLVARAVEGGRSARDILQM